MTMKSVKLRTSDVMRMFDVSEVTVRRWVRQGMPCTKIGSRLVIYDSMPVVRWVTDNKPWHLYKKEG
jgi:phage terminase Nu1 subunit (DNA packaging protein)